MSVLQVIGAGLPRTATSSLALALERLLGGRVHSMSAIPGHPFDLGAGWDQALAGETADWDQLFDGYVAAVDWPSSLFWPGLSRAFPGALVVLSTRDSAQAWLESCEATILPYARMAASSTWEGGCGLVSLFERFAGTSRWDDPAVLVEAYDRHNARARQTAPAGRFLDWRASQGWEPLCQALALPIPEEPFPWINRRSEWTR